MAPPSCTNCAAGVELIAICDEQVKKAGFPAVTCERAEASDVGEGNWNAIICAFGLWTVQDFNHKIGANVLTADMSVNWFRDDGQIAAMLAMDPRDATAATRVLEAWRTLDRAGRRGGSPAVPGNPGGRGL